MFKLSYSPQYGTSNITISKQAETLTINGESFDFSALEDGSEIDTECSHIVGTVKRLNGDIHITILLPHGVNSYFAPTEPQEVTADGDIALPDGRFEIFDMNNFEFEGDI